jgi:muramoyltetrapeptide carboxypeptidase LdcA involved in peptidoglycan recycling
VDFWKAVSGPICGQRVDGSTWRVLRGAGTVAGPVVGGQFGTVGAPIGTRYLPSLRGTVLLLEEAFVSWSQVDQALTHFRLQRRSVRAEPFTAPSGFGAVSARGTREG